MTKKGSLSIWQNYANSRKHATLVVIWTRYCAINSFAALKDPWIQRELLCVQKLTVAQALERARAMEAVAKEAKHLQFEGGNTEADGAPTHQMRRTEILKCHRCGSTDHLAAKCSHKDKRCHKCHKVGHLAHVCKSTKARVGTRSRNTHVLEADSGSSGSGDESDELGATLAGVHKVAQGGSKYRKLITTLKIKGKNIDFEVDTGNNPGCIISSKAEGSWAGAFVCHPAPVWWHCTANHRGDSCGSVSWSTAGQRPVHYHGEGWQSATLARTRLAVQAPPWLAQDAQSERCWWPPSTHATLSHIDEWVSIGDKGRARAAEGHQGRSGSEDRSGCTILQKSASSFCVARSSRRGHTEASGRRGIRACGPEWVGGPNSGCQEEGRQRKNMCWL